MKFKHLVISILLVMMICVAAQSQVADARGSSPTVKEGVKPSDAAPVLKTETLFYIRDLQYEQAKRVLEMKQLEARYKKLQEDIDGLAKSADAIVVSDAKAAQIDLIKWSFDFDKLKFVPREKPAPASPGATPNTKPNN